MNGQSILVRADPELADLIPRFLENRRAALIRIERLPASDLACVEVRYD